MSATVNDHDGSSILLLGSQMATGGSQSVLLRQGTWFFEHGYSVTAAFFYDKENLSDVWRAQHPFPILNLGFAPPTAGLFKQVFFFLRGLFHLLSVMKKGRYLAVETFTHHANLIGLPLAWMAGIPNRVGSHRGRGFPRIVEWLNAVVANSSLTTRFVVVSGRVRDDAIAEGIRPDRMITIANGVQIPDVDPADVARIREALGVRINDFLLLSVGRLTQQKAHAVLLHALPSVLAEFPNVVLALAGDGPLLDTLQSEAQQLKVVEQVRFLGMRRDVPVLLASADLFLFSSQSEGMPNAVLEAMGCGLPVISTAVQGAEELIRDGENGLIVSVDDAAAFSEVILRLLQNSEERRQLGKAARTTVQKEYTLDTMCIQYEKLLTANRT